VAGNGNNGDSTEARESLHLRGKCANLLARLYHTAEVIGLEVEK
jgi:hypothetical protein